MNQPGETLELRGSFDTGPLAGILSARRTVGIAPRK